MEIRPFRAYRYDAKVVGDVGRCIAPPYDVISDAQQEQLYAQSPYNIVRIIKGKIEPSDNEQRNQYTRAAECLRQWIDQGALKQDSEETIYGYVQDFVIDGISYRRLSFVALAKLEDFGPIVRPHEQVFVKPMIDRLNLKRAAGARFGLVFMLYEDPQNVADKIVADAMSRPALIDFVDDQQVRHRLFGLTNAEDVDRIVTMMRDKSCVIADGHHRYTTGLTLSKESTTETTQYQMLSFTNTSQDGLIVLATHRIVANLTDFDPRAFVEKLAVDFEITTLPFDNETSKTEAKARMLEHMKARHDQDRIAFGVYCGDGRFYLAVLKDPARMDAAAGQMSPAWRSLDVSVLQKLILEHVLGIDDEKMSTGQFVEYVKDTPSAVDDSIAAIDDRAKQIAFLTNPVKLAQLKNVTDAGERMPQKSTYFFPKMYTGLTIQKL